MGSELMLDVGQANELKMAFRRAGWSNEDIKRFCEGNTVVEVRHVLLGYSQIVPIEHAVNGDATPFLPQGWQGVEEHRKGGVVKLERRGDDLYTNGEKIELFLLEDQKSGGCVVGNDLRKELAKKLVLNANILDYLLKPENQHLIPESWKGKYVVCFWGTIFRGSGGGLCVRCLCWDGDRWDWFYYWLDSDFGDHDPAAVSASH